MSRTIAPPRQSAPATADALFAEARRRRRRRRLAGLAVVLALTAAVAVAFILARPNRAPTAAGADRGRARPVSTPGAALAGSVAWVDYNGRVHLGDLAVQRTVLQHLSRRFDFENLRHEPVRCW